MTAPDQSGLKGFKAGLGFALGCFIVIALVGLFAHESQGARLNAMFNAMSSQLSSTP